MKTLKLLLTSVLLLCSSIVSAYSFEVDGIYYDFISDTDKTVSVASSPNKYSGDIVIPETVVYNDVILLQC